MLLCTAEKRVYSIIVNMCVWASVSSTGSLAFVIAL